MFLKGLSMRKVRKSLDYFHKYIILYPYDTRMYHEFMHKLRIWGITLSDMIFPRTCLGCGSSGTTLCATCLSTIPAPHANLPDWIFALYSYKHPLIKKSIWRLKYNYTYDIGQQLGKSMHHFLLQKFPLQTTHSPVYLIPIPLSHKRMRERGYNQAALLSNAMITHDHSGMIQDGSFFLRRQEMQNRQSHTKNKSERLRNIQGSFLPGEPLPAPAHFILIDDVVTTGATLAEAKKVLVQMGAQKISALTIAH